MKSDFQIVSSESFVSIVLLVWSIEVPYSEEITLLHVVGIIRLFELFRNYSAQLSTWLTGINDN